MRKGIVIVFIANIINMMFSMVTSFFLPRYLSIESYGYYKVFQLYVNYLGIAHLGFVDGIYLKYGGREIRDIDADELLTSTATVRNMQIVIMIAAGLVFGIMKNPIAILLAFSCVPINMISYYKNLYQATGEFKNYGIILSVLPMLTFVWDILLLFVFRTDNYIYYILVILCSNLILYCLLENKSRKIFGKGRFFAFNPYILIENIRSGITLTIGNFSSILITSIDRWCIQVWMSLQAFSYYSFAVSVENLFNVCLSAVTTTLYNYLCKTAETEKIIQLKSICIILSTYVVAVAFPVKFFIRIWIPKYEASISCLFILVCAHAFYFVIKAIYVNLYKARGQQSHYFHQMLLILLIAFVANSIAYWGIVKCIEAFAYASLVTAVIWFFICYFEFETIRGKNQDVLFLILCAAAYLFCGLKIDNAILGLVTYLIFVTVMVLILCKNNFLILVSVLIKSAAQITADVKYRKEKSV